MNFLNKKSINIIKEFSLAGFKVKDQYSFLGFLWSFLNPLIMTTILFFLFRSSMTKNIGQEYFIYILVGTVVWNFFVMSTTVGLNSLISKPEMIKSAVFPKEILVYSDIGVFIIQHLFELAVIFLFILIFKTGFSLHILFLPFIVCVEILLIIGLSLFLSCLCVYARDTTHIWNVVTRIAFFLVPVFYNPSIVTPTFRWLVFMNPMSQIIIFSRDVLIYHRTPSLSNLAFTSAFALFIFIAGHKFFKHFEYKVAERV